MPLPFAIPWYGIYTEAVDAVWLSRVILAHAAELTEAVRALEEVRRAEEPPELLRFEDVLADAPAAADGTVACDNGLVESSAPLPDLLASGARCVFGVPSLRPRQEEAVTRILFEPGTGCKLLLVERTGGGKSVVLAMVAVTAAGVAIVVVPLLALTADQQSRLDRAVQRFGPFRAIQRAAASAATRAPAAVASPDSSARTR